MTEPKPLLLPIHLLLLTEKGHKIPCMPDKAGSAVDIMYQYRRAVYDPHFVTCPACKEEVSKLTELSDFYRRQK